MMMMTEDRFLGLNMMNDFLHIETFAKDLTSKEQKQMLILHGVAFLGMIALIAISRIFC